MKKRQFVNVLLVLAGIIFLSAPAIWAQEQPCQADMDCSGRVDLGDLNILKAEYFQEDCDPSTQCPSPNCIPPAPVPKTGQTTCYNTLGTPIDCTDTGQDGDHKAGVEWPNPRFTDNSDGTVTDNLTGLIWLKDANCFGTRTWTQALSDCNGLASPSCGLSDNSTAGDWRLPNVKELQSLIDFEYYDPALPNTAGTGKWTAGNPFTGVQSGYYWSGTSYAYNPYYAWYVYMHHGRVSILNKTYYRYVWPVRGGND